MDRRAVLVVAVAVVSVAGAMAVGARMTAPPAPSAAPSASDEIAARIRGLEQQLERSPDDLAGWKMLGRSYLAEHRYMEAVGAYSRAAQIDPRDPEVAGALKQLETIARDRGRHDETMKGR